MLGTKLFICTKIEGYVISGELLELRTLHGRVCSLLSTSCHCADKHNFKSIQTVLCNTLLLLCNKIEKHSTVASAVVGYVSKPAFTLAYLVDKLLSSYLSLPPTFHHVTIYLCNNAYRGPQVVKSMASSRAKF